MKNFLYEDIFPVSFVLFFLVTMEYVLGKYLFPENSISAIILMFVVVILSVVMFLVLVNHIKKRTPYENTTNKYEISNVLTLSTGHLPQHEFEAMQVDDELPIVVIDHLYGVILIFYNFDEEYCKETENYIRGHFPNLWNIYKLAKENDCRYINFDRDGELYNDLKQFHW